MTLGLLLSQRKVNTKKKNLENVEFVGGTTLFNVLFWLKQLVLQSVAVTWMTGNIVSSHYFCYIFGTSVRRSSGRRSGVPVRAVDWFFRVYI